MGLHVIFNNMSVISWL